MLNKKIYLAVVPFFPISTSIKYRGCRSACLRLLQINYSLGKLERTIDMKLCAEEGIEMPTAPLVWQVVEYAIMRTLSHHDILSSNYCNCRPSESCKRITRETIIFDFVTEWLIAHGHNNFALILEFQQQYNSLTDFVKDTIHRMGFSMDSAKLDDQYTDCPFAVWLILQGKKTFDAVIANEDLTQLCYENKGHDDYQVVTVMGRMFAFHDFNGFEVMEWFDHKLCNGATPQDFVGWDVHTALVQFGKDGSESDQEACMTS